MSGAGGRQVGFEQFGGEHAHLGAGHLSEVPPETGVKLTAHVERSEAWCQDCNNRVTVGPDGDEYGHARDCEHSCWGQR